MNENNYYNIILLESSYRMKALITGASSGIGADMARILSNKGYDLILVARRKDRLERLQNELKTDVEIISMDISSTFNCIKLYNKVKKQDIDILINNAGFGMFGFFERGDLDKELDMIDLNIKTVHTLTKLFLQDFVKRDKGYILNVASSAAFLPGPLMATYYATKAYVLRLTEAIYEELRRTNSKVYIGALCPGPAETEFNDVANVSFSVKSMKSYDVADYAIKEMFKRKLVIVPSLMMKLTRFISILSPTKLKLRVTYNIQKNKQK